MLVLATWLLFIVAGQSGYAYPHMTDPAHLTLSRAFCLVATGGTIFAAVLIYETMNRTLREELSAERSLFERMADGTSLLEMVNFDEHCANLAAGRWRSAPRASSRPRSSPRGPTRRAPQRSGTPNPARPARSS